MLTVEEVAEHFRLRPDTVRGRIKSGELPAVRIHREYRLEWRDVWACEQGPVPKGPREARYRVPLLTKKHLATALKVGMRTVERWIAAGLPTRNAFGAIRMNPHDVEGWFKARGVTLPPDWWR